MKTIISFCVILIFSGFSFAQINGKNERENLLRNHQSLFQNNKQGRSTHFGSTSSIKPLFVLDNKVISEEEMRLVDPNHIESINILKDKSATALYGEAGKNGVVVITTKKEKIKAKKSKEEIKKDIENEPILAI